MDKIPPQALEAEMAVLGSMLIEKEAIIKVLDIITDQDFYKESHRLIFREIRDLYLENQAVDAVVVSSKLKKDKLLNDVGGAFYITELINNVSTAANVEHYAQIVREKAILRQLINTGTNIVTSAFNEKTPAEEILDTAERLLFSIAEKRSHGFSHIKELTHPAIEYLEKLHKNKKDVPGLRTGFAELDSMTAGLQPSELILLAGRPSMGKTALGLNIVEHVALEQKKPVAIFSIEMSKESLMMRLMCSASRVNAHKARTGYIGTRDWPALTTAATKLSEADIYIDDSTNLSILELRARARRLATELKVQKKELALVVIDYIQMMRGTGRSESRQQEMSEISRSLKGLARDLRVPVLALSQLSRKPEEKGRGEKKPQLSDLRESGALEQDADVVAFIYREEYYGPTEENKNKATIILAKQRNGPTGELELNFFRDYTRFENPVRYENSEKIAVE
ncbi:MAG: replicative DNA helicase [Elusimicrobia bacterium]|nr:replicative DNA helicase [Candidatus Liberimonas magnetica]